MMNLCLFPMFLRATYSYMPDVFIYNAGNGYKMQVEYTVVDARRIK